MSWMLVVSVVLYTTAYEHLFSTPAQVFSLDRSHLYWQMGCFLIHPARVPGYSVSSSDFVLFLGASFNVQCTRIWRRCLA